MNHVGAVTNRAHGIETEFASRLLVVWKEKKPMRGFEPPTY